MWYRNCVAAMWAWLLMARMWHVSAPVHPLIKSSLTLIDTLYLRRIKSQETILRGFIHSAFNNTRIVLFMHNSSGKVGGLCDHWKIQPDSGVLKTTLEMLVWLDPIFLLNFMLLSLRYTDIRHYSFKPGYHHSLDVSYTPLSLSNFPKGHSKGQSTISAHTRPEAGSSAHQGRDRST